MARIVTLFTQLTPADIERPGGYYASGAVFKDRSMRCVGWRRFSGTPQVNG